jgi:hypothetical protein
MTISCSGEGCDAILGAQNESGLCGKCWQRGESRRAARRAFSAKNREAIRAAAKVMYDHQYELIATYKVSVGCADCGYNDRPEALHFDHLPEHEKSNVPSQMWNYNLEKFLAEIAKCDLVCANCHFVRTSARNGKDRQFDRLDPEVAMKNLQEGWKRP